MFLVMVVSNIGIAKMFSICCYVAQLNMVNIQPPFDYAPLGLTMFVTILIGRCPMLLSAPLWGYVLKDMDYSG